MDNVSLIENILEHSSYDDILMDLGVQGFRIIENIECDTELVGGDNAVFDAEFEVAKDGIIYSILMTGKALAETVDDGFTEFYGYRVTTYRVTSYNVASQEPPYTDNRTCKSCKHYKYLEVFDYDDYRWTCTNEDVYRFVSCPPEDFGCIHYEQK